MNILISSRFFHPSIGGIEEVGGLLALEFSRAGHRVRVVTHTAENDGAALPFEVIRRVSPFGLCRSVAWCDVFFQNNLSLRTAWPLLFFRRPWVVAHHTWISRPDGSLGLRDRWKRRLIRHASNIAVSEALARSFSAPAVVIGNPYRDEVFRLDPGAARGRELIFVGRLVSDKGVDILLQALARLKERGCRPALTIVGAGPEERGLRQQSAALQLESQVEFVGSRRGADLAALLNRHRILVVPSRWREPFGLVALEGIACGCAVVGSEQGGLKDAIGPGGATFHNGDSAALAACLEEALRAGGDGAGDRQKAQTHLEKHRPDAVARAYLEVFAAAAANSAKSDSRPSL
jgi:glycosyltransferase involved in cell wall biosynthesis